MKVKRASMLRVLFAFDLIDKTWNEGGQMSSTTAGNCWQARAEVSNALYAKRPAKKGRKNR